MKISIITVGKKHDPELAGAIEEFSARLSKYHLLEWKVVPSDGGERSTLEEGRAILSAVSDKDYVVALDEGGAQLSSEELADFLQKRLNGSVQRLVFIIGGAYGLHEDVLSRAQAVISLSRLTFPHMLVRLILVEQLYRACTILQGSKYHHS